MAVDLTDQGGWFQQDAHETGSRWFEFERIRFSRETLAKHFLLGADFVKASASLFSRAA